MTPQHTTALRKQEGDKFGFMNPLQNRAETATICREGLGWAFVKDIGGRVIAEFKIDFLLTGIFDAIQVGV